MASTPKKLVVFGGTGPTGLLFLKKALEHGHEVTAYVRNESKITADIKSNAKLKIVKGQLTDKDIIASAIEGQDIVVSILGPQLGKLVPNSLTNAYRNILPAMRQHNVTRILALATASYSDPKDSRAVMRDLLVGSLKLAQKPVYNEINGIVKVFDNEGEGLDWTVYRVGGLANGTDEQVTTTYVGAADASLNINRVAIVKWLIDEVEQEQPRYVREKPFICTQGVHLWHLRI